LGWYDAYFQGAGADGEIIVGDAACDEWDDDLPTNAAGGRGSQHPPAPFALKFLIFGSFSHKKTDITVGFFVVSL
jgi:hypothetical protein